MIISRLQGGLGNQLFQYASARALAMRTGRRLGLDASALRLRPDRPYQLDRFNIEASLVSQEDISRHFWPRSPGPRLQRALERRLFSPDGLSLVREEGHEFQPGLLSRRGPVILEGCWQSEKYFSAEAPLIRQELTLRDGMSPAAATLVSLASTGRAVSVHIRRGDYLRPEQAAFHGCLTPAYYRRAMALIATQVESPHFLIFSDDLPWARQHIDSPFPLTFVDINHGACPHEELMIMRQCRHHIIANSSFSWWGAWLNASEASMVIAPRHWFLADVDTSHLIPERWIRIDS